MTVALAVVAVEGTVEEDAVKGGAEDVGGDVVCGGDAAELDERRTRTVRVPLPAVLPEPDTATHCCAAVVRGASTGCTAVGLLTAGSTVVGFGAP